MSAGTMLRKISSHSSSISGRPVCGLLLALLASAEGFWGKWLGGQRGLGIGVIELKGDGGVIRRTLMHCQECWDLQTACADQEQRLRLGYRQIRCSVPKTMRCSCA